MADVTSYRIGQPCWADVTVADVAAAAAFYGELFGWEAEKDPRPEAGGYTMLSRNGKHVAAASPPQQDGTPPHWTVYLASDDVDATTGRIRRGGRDGAGGAVRRLRLRSDDDRSRSLGRRFRCVAGGHSRRLAAARRAGDPELGGSADTRPCGRPAVLRACLRLRSDGPRHGAGRRVRRVRDRRHARRRPPRDRPGLGRGPEQLVGRLPGRRLRCGRGHGARARRAAAPRPCGDRRGRPASGWLPIPGARCSR